MNPVERFPEVTAGDLRGQRKPQTWISRGNGRVKIQLAWAVVVGWGAGRTAGGQARRQTGSYIAATCGITRRENDPPFFFFYVRN